MSDSASAISSRPRQVVQVNSRLDKNLAAYMVAAGAAGVSLLAVQSAQAKIVYTPANVSIGPRTSFLLDLNNDGLKDFIISNWQYGHASHLSVVHEASANEVIVRNLTYGEAADLPFGVQIGPNRPFEKVGFMAQQSSVSGASANTGPWKDATNRYLGLKFSINGQTHFGWARLTVNAKGGIFATLTGYAYETVPNKPIVVGKISGPDVASAVAPQEILAPSPQSSSRPATLGMLARGSDSVAIWRRDEEPGVPTS